MGDFGSTRHILLIGLIGAVLLLGLHWQGRVSCLLGGVAYGLSSPSGISSINC